MIKRIGAAALVVAVVGLFCLGLPHLGRSGGNTQVLWSPWTDREAAKGDRYILKYVHSRCRSA